MFQKGHVFVSFGTSYPSKAPYIWYNKTLILKTMNADQTIHFQRSESCDVMDELQSSYYITLEQTSTTPRDIFMCEYHNDEEDIKSEEHNICFYGGAESYHGLFISKVFADTEAQALKREIKIRNEAIAKGEWGLAWERHKLQQSRFNKKSR